MITETGVNLVLAENKNKEMIDSVYRKINISVNLHNSKSIAVTAHHVCAGNPSAKEEQISQVRKAANLLKEKYPSADVIGLWIDQNRQVNAINLSTWFL